nr:hypothetical protein [Hankyongella ginsenosidimutans]
MQLVEKINVCLHPLHIAPASASALAGKNTINAMIGEYLLDRSAAEARDLPAFACYEVGLIERKILGLRVASQDQDQ